MSEADARARVHELRAEGLTQRDIAKRMGLSRGKVRRMLDAPGPEVGQSGPAQGGPKGRVAEDAGAVQPRDPEEQTRELARLVVVERMTQRAAARQVGCSQSTVYNRLSSPLGLQLLTEARAALDAVAGVELAQAGRVGLEVLERIALDEEQDARQRVAAASRLVSTAHDPKRERVDVADLVGAAAQGAATGAAVGADLAEALKAMAGMGASFDDVVNVDLMEVVE